MGNKDRDCVKLYHGALDEVSGGTIILRGVIDPDSFGLFKQAEYQREVLPIQTINEIIDAMVKGDPIPDIDLGARGGNFREREPGVFVLPNDVYIIDGLQRVTAAREMMRRYEDAKPRLGATVHFNSNEEWERERFRILNADRTKVNSNILLRNMRADVPAIETIYNLTLFDLDFVLVNRVSWCQRQTREQLISAVSFAKVIGALHSHVGPGLSNGWRELGRGIEVIHNRVGRNILRENIRTFFDLVDKAWGIRVVTFKEGATHLRLTFLMCLALLLSRHTSFWRDKRLYIERDLARKIAQFPINDPQVRNLASAGGTAHKILYTLLLDHVNSGKRTRRLVGRQESVVSAEEVEAAIAANGE